MKVQKKIIDRDIILIEKQIIPIMKSFILEKNSLHMPKETVIESWLKALLSVALLGEELYYTNLYSYLQVILDDPAKCEFFTEEQSREDIFNFLDTLII